MIEYYGNSAMKYKQPSDKPYTLFSGLQRCIPQAKNGQTLLDLGCGTGDLHDFVIQKGYDYYGLDISGDMLKQARNKYSKTQFYELNAVKADELIRIKFNVVMANMLFPSLPIKADFFGVFRAVRKLVKNDGIFVIGVMHSCFDGYMQKKLFKREDIETKFQGYFADGSNYKVHRKFDDVNFIFNDYHWVLSDYFIAAKNFGFYIDTLDECPLTGKVPVEIVEKNTTKGVPNYLVLVLRRRT